jgi:hypothetical protein
MSGKIQTDSIFELLQLPPSSDLTKVRKAYYKKVDELEKELKKLDDNPEKEQVSTKLRLLEKTFHDFSQNIQQNTKQFFDTQQALKKVDLNQNADWETIESKYRQEISQADPENKAILEANFKALQQNADWFKKNTGIPAKTLYASLGILVAAGISIAAISQFSGGSLLDSVQSLGESLTPADTAPSDLTIDITNGTQEEQIAGLNQYTEDNMAFEDEILFNMGAIPDIRQSLSVDYKLQILQSMVKNI